MAAAGLWVWSDGILDGDEAALRIEGDEDSGALRVFVRLSTGLWLAPTLLLLLLPLIDVASLGIPLGELADAGGAGTRLVIGVVDVASRILEREPVLSLGSIAEDVPARLPLPAPPAAALASSSTRSAIAGCC